MLRFCQTLVCLFSVSILTLALGLEFSFREFGRVVQAQVVQQLTVKEISAGQTESTPNESYAATQESEPNNDFASANPINSGATNFLAATAANRGSPDFLDFFKFTAIGGLPYTIEIFNAAKAINNQGGAMQLVVYDSNFSEVDKDVDYDSNGVGNVVASVDFVPNTTGTYYLKVSSYYIGDGTGPYNIRILPRYDQPEASWNSAHEPNNAATHAFKLTVGALNAITSTIQALNSAYLADSNRQYDVDWFYFSAVAGQTYVIETYNVAKAVNTSGGALQLFLYDSNTARIATEVAIAQDDNYDSNGTGNRNASLSFIVNTTGVYFIQLSPWPINWGSGNYSIRILPKYDQAETAWDANYEPNNWAEHAPTLQIGARNAISTTMEGLDSAYLVDSNVPYDTDWFRFDAVAGQTYVIETFNIAKAVNPSNYAMQLYIYDNNFSKLVEDTGGDSNGAGNTNASIEFVANTTGSHFILIQPYYYTADSGPYRIRILPRYDQPEADWDTNHEPNNWPNHAHKIEVGSTNAIQTNIERRESAYITDRDDIDVFWFEAIAGQPYVVETFNAAKAINPSNYAMQLFVYDSNGSQVGKDDGGDSIGAGNTNATVEFVATLGGRYYVVIYPYSYAAAAGPYSLRVLPHYNQPNASWGADMEPNNNKTHPFPLNVDPCARLTSIEPRNASNLTDAPDRDWFVFTVQQGKQYSFVLSEFGTQFGSNSLEAVLYNREFSKVKESLFGNPPQVTFTADYDGVYYALVYPYTDNSGNYRVKIFEALGSGCPGEPPPRAAVEGNVSSGANPDTGEVTIRGPRGGAQVTIPTLAYCPSGTPQNVTLWIGTNSYPMTLASGERYVATLTLPTGAPNMSMRATYTCGGTTVTNLIGNVVLIDPSGQITDRATGAPIAGAQVTLYHVVNALPDGNGQTRDCRTIDTRGGNDWSQLPPAMLKVSERIDGLAENISTSPQISPKINPQITGADGRYAWDVVTGCWYLEVTAAGYLPVISPLVGIPPAVSDLHIQLTPGTVQQKVYLPVVQR